jgi:hypothetical protein
MQDIATSETAPSIERQNPESMRNRNFVQQASIAAAALYSVFSVVLLVAAPEIAFFLWIWFLWFAVMITAVITYEAGRYLSRSRMRVEHPVTADPSLRMGRWTVG